MMVIHYNDTPLPVGNPTILNDEEGAYSLGLADGPGWGDQWASEPEATVTFESRKAAKAWLKAVRAVLEPYIKEGDREARVPSPEGWEMD